MMENKIRTADKEKKAEEIMTAKEIGRAHV